MGGRYKGWCNAIYLEVGKIIRKTKIIMMSSHLSDKQISRTTERFLRSTIIALLEKGLFFCKNKYLNS